MKKFNILISFLMIAGLVAAAPAFGAGMNQSGSSSMNQPEKNPGAMPSGTLSHSIDLSYLLHKTVRNEQGKTIGKISDVMVGPEGQVQFVILSRHGIFRTSGKYIPLPWKTFTSHWTNMAQLNSSEPIVFTLAQTRLDNAPGYANRNEFTSGAMREKVCQYFKGQCAENVLHPESAS